MEKTQSTEKKWILGAMLLTASTIVVKILGFFYKIPMLSALGEEGMGYFHSAFEIYAWIGNIAAAGVPVGLSILIARALARNDENGANALFHGAAKVLFLFGTAASLAMFFGADLICRLLSNPNAAGCMRAISPGTFFLCLSTVLRGYHQGYGRMLPTALSQVFEAVGKLAFGLCFVWIGVRRGANVRELAQAAGWGLSLGNFVCFLQLLLMSGKRVFVRTEAIGKPQMHGLLRLSVPMIAGTALTGFSRIVEIGLIMGRLQTVGFSASEANLLLGGYTTMSLSVFSLIPTLVSGVTTPLLPILSGESAKKENGKGDELVSLSFGLTAFFAVPASVCISAYAKEILLFLFSNAPEAASRAAPTLALLGPSVLLSCLIASVTSVLQAHRKTKEPLIALGAGILLKILFSFLLLGIPSVGLLGIPISTFFCDLTVICFDLYFAEPFLPKILFSEIFGLPTVSVILAVISTRIGCGACSQTPSFLLQIILIVPLYFLFYSLLTGILTFFTKKESGNRLVLVFFLKKLHKK